MGGGFAGATGSFSLVSTSGSFSSRTASGKHAWASLRISSYSASSSLGYRSESFGISSLTVSLSFLTSSLASVGLGDDERGCVRGGHSGRQLRSQSCAFCDVNVPSSVKMFFGLASCVAVSSWTRLSLHLKGLDVAVVVSNNNS